ncbi:MAG TPA: succinate dehydrogenase assembly factor 2 [Parvularcula sp.]|nr:succinate dehydrogenase assembly factor 2 [Parvularcula sp.]HBS31450.1 succinate dehydrogenase assembly factor 2 [Parvularcula sp.]HBS36205.1 succinate dehydrogenase assembly factor 2 [Parvularcula sp.]
MTEPAETRRKRLLHRARYRGFKEADLLIGGFAEASVAAMSEAELDAFEAILALNDHDIYALVLGAAAPPANVDIAMIARMRAFDASKRA